MKRYARLALTVALLAAVPVRTAPPQEIDIAVKKLLEERTRIAVPGFAGAGGALGDTLGASLADILIADLRQAGFFYPLPDKALIAERDRLDRRSGDINFREWGLMRAELLVKGDLEQSSTELALATRVFDVARGQEILRQDYVGGYGQRRRLVHDLADDIVYKLTGEVGIAGTQIAFVSDRFGPSKIYLMDYDGHNQRRITSGDYDDTYPDWSFDGSRLILSSLRNKWWWCYEIDLEIGSFKQVLNYPGMNWSSDYSPDGRYVAFNSAMSGSIEIYRIDSDFDRSSLRRLTWSRAQDQSPDWSPDGSQIAFTSDRTGTPQIWVMSTDASDVRRITFAGNNNSHPAWSPRGDWIAFIHMVDNNFDIALVDPVSSTIVPITEGGGMDEEPSWAPDGRHLVYSSRRAHNTEIYMIDINERVPVRLTNTVGNNKLPAWSPNLRRR